MVATLNDPVGSAPIYIDPENASNSLNCWKPSFRFTHGAMSRAHGTARRAGTIRVRTVAAIPHALEQRVGCAPLGTRRMADACARPERRREQAASSTIAIPRI